MFKKRGQVWVETVIYTLIAFMIMGLVLAFAKPKIEEAQDKAIIEQSISMMEDMNTLILSMLQGGQGNTRIIEIAIRKGTLTINGAEDKLVFEMEGAYQYSQPGVEISQGSILITTESLGKLNKVTLVLDYSGKADLTHNNKDELKPLSKAGTSYRLLFDHKGTKIGSVVPTIDLGVV